MSEKPKTLFRVRDHADRTIVRVAAKSNAAARKYAASMLVVEKMSVAEIVRAAQSGYAIIDAETGTLVNPPEDDAPSVAAARVSNDEE